MTWPVLNLFVISFMLCYVSSENAGCQEKMPLPKCQWRHFVLPAFSLAFNYSIMPHRSDKLPAKNRKEIRQSLCISRGSDKSW